MKRLKPRVPMPRLWAAARARLAGSYRPQLLLPPADLEPRGDLAGQVVPAPRGVREPFRGVLQQAPHGGVVGVRRGLGRPVDAAAPAPVSAQARRPTWRPGAATTPLVGPPCRRGAPPDLRPRTGRRPGRWWWAGGLGRRCVGRPDHRQQRRRPTASPVATHASTDTTLVTEHPLELCERGRHVVRRPSAAQGPSGWISRLSSAAWRDPHRAVPHPSRSDQGARYPGPSVRCWTEGPTSASPTG